jgi:hypothetical protein
MRFDSPGSKWHGNTTLAEHRSGSCYKVAAFS